MRSAEEMMETRTETVETPSNDNASGGILKGKTIEQGSGRRLFGVVVELVGTGRAYVTSPTGYFKLEDVPAGKYTARFTFPGFEPVEEPVSIHGGETLDLTVEFERAD